MTFVNRLLVATLTLASVAANAQRPSVGSTVTLQAAPGDAGRAILSTPLYPAPSTGRETVAERHAMTRAIQDMSVQACGFSRDEQRSIRASGQKPFSFNVTGLQEVSAQATMTNGQVRSETHLWVRVVNMHRPACAGWWDLGLSTASSNRG